MGASRQFTNLRREAALSDLRDQKLFFTDPFSEIATFRTDLPPGLLPEPPFATYVFCRFPQEKMPCVKCKRRIHRDGFLSYLATGDVVSFGSCCGPKLFGGSFTTMKRELGRRRSRQLALFRLDGFRSAVRLLLEDLHNEWLLQIDESDHLNERIRSLDRFLSSQLAVAATRDDKALAISRRIDGARSEILRATVLANSNRTKDYDLPQYEEIAVHHLQGSDFIKWRRLKRTLGVATSTILKLRDVATQPDDNLTTKKIVELTKDVSECLDLLDEIADAHDAAVAFCSPANFAGIVEFAKHHGDIHRRLSMRNGTLVATADNEHNEQRIALPDDFERLDRTAVNGLRTKLRMTGIERK